MKTIDEILKETVGGGDYDEWFCLLKENIYGAINEIIGEDKKPRLRTELGKASELQKVIYESVCDSSANELRKEQRKRLAEFCGKESKNDDKRD